MGHAAGAPRAAAALRAAVALVALVLVAGCGAARYTYVTNSADHTYLKVPASWTQIDEQDLNNAIGLDPAESAKDRGLWLQGYDADPKPSPLHLFGSHAPSPAVFVSVRHVPTGIRGQLSLDALRDLFFPVSPSGRERDAADPTSRFSDFALYSDDVLTPGHGVHGVHSVFRYRLGTAPPQTIDQTAYVNEDASMIYALFVRCSTECYKQRRREIEAVVSSFTVRERG